MEWVIFDDVLREVEALELPHDESECAQRRANVLWAEECFGLELYEVDGDHKTKAAALQAWAQQGYDRAECERWWDQGAKIKRLEVPPAQVDAAWRQKRLMGMMEAQFKATL